MATASFENAVRFHKDAVLMFEENRIPSALLMSALSVEEIGKYFMLEDVWWHNLFDSKWTIQEMQQFLRGAYSHMSKQRWFAGQTLHNEFISKDLLKILLNGELEIIKQKATYVGIPRKGQHIDFDKHLSSPFRTSKRRTEDLITMVNDFFIDLAVGIRKRVYHLDIPEIDNWLAEQEFEQQLVKLWPKMRYATKKRIARMRELEEDKER